ncbi:sterol carrier family protein [Nocardioides piscis]|uniref:Bacterial SCP orthologue domain-containing protein n=1 Tax=Nocardioides piscis TaxID=2714938 RepID=A0A6G7YE43_9ACTN|nr:sterol carrier family protein [Nocardioides piscis]QIK75174.1 hypothetical protein G7071_06795 [Nocardioides piscis]
MPVRLRPATQDAVAAALASRTSADDKLLVKHFLAVLAERAPGASVEVRVPPYAAAQVVPGVRHTRGTPPAVVETDAATWIALATGGTTWAEAVAAGAVVASGERTDLSAYLPLTPTNED